MDALVHQARRFPDLGIEGVRTDGLEARDAGLARAIYGVVSRRWLTLRYLIDRHLQRDPERLDPKALAALLAGGAQLLFLDRLPAHAVVHETVEWIKHAQGPGAGRMVNAVMRRLCEDGLVDDRQFRDSFADGRDEIPLGDGRALVLSGELLPEDPLQRLSVATSVPLELLRSWCKTFSMREARTLALHGLVEAPVILNTASAESALPENCEAHTAPGHHVFHGEHSDLERLLRARNDIWVQDPGSSLAAESVTDLRPGLIVDLCAGKGTKTRQLSKIFPDAEIVATDIDEPRRKTLRQSVGSEQVRVVDFAQLDAWAGKADLVLLDVPCSNTGVLGRRVEAKYRFDVRRTEDLIGTQRQIVADSIRLLASGGARGRLLYSTCSLDPAENESQVAWAAKWHSLEVSREHRRAPAGLPGDGPVAYSDGSYAALLE